MARRGTRVSKERALSQLLSGRADLAVDETFILLHPAVPLVGVSIVMERERQENDSLVNG